LLCTSILELTIRIKHYFAKDTQEQARLDGKGEIKPCKLQEVSDNIEINFIKIEGQFVLSFKSLKQIYNAISEQLGDEYAKIT